MNKTTAFYQRSSFVFIVAMVVSLLLSAGINLNETVINPDAICYLLSAEAVGKSGIATAMHLCPQAIWPFYSVLIYQFANVTHLSYVTSAYLLDAVLSMLSVVSFIAIVKELGGSLRVMWLAALVILLAHEFNGVRDYIVRDHGFWAFYLASIFVLLKFINKPSWITAITWGASLAIATLFRIEGAVFLIAVPIIICRPDTFFVSGIQPNPIPGHKNRVRATLKLYSFPLLCLIALTTWLLLHPQQSLDKLGRIAELPNQLHYGFLTMLERYQTMKAALAQYVLTSDSTNDAGLVLILVFIGWYLVSIISNLSWIYSALVIYAWQRKTSAFTSQGRTVLASYLIVNIIITASFLLERSFLSKRYLIALTLVLMLWVPFALNELWQNRASRYYRLATGLVAIFIFFSAIGGIFNFGYSKSYIRNAGDWVAAFVPTTASLYANDIQLMYYSQHYGDTIFAQNRAYADINTIAHGRWKQYDYLALRVGKKDDQSLLAVVQEINQPPIQVFMNKRGDKVAIYRVKQEIVP